MLPISSSCFGGMINGIYFRSQQLYIVDTLENENWLDTIGLFNIFDNMYFERICHKKTAPSMDNLVSNKQLGVCKTSEFSSIL